MFDSSVQIFVERQILRFFIIGNEARFFTYHPKAKASFFR